MGVKRLAALAAAGVMLCGCASITRGTSENLQVNSDPPGADVKFSNGFACSTPCMVPVQRKEETVISISKPGFQPEQVVVRTQLGGGGAAGVAGNILLGGAIGIGVDVATGAALDHCPNPVFVILQPVGKPRRADLKPPEAQCTPRADVASAEAYPGREAIH